MKSHIFRSAFIVFSLHLTNCFGKEYGGGSYEWDLPCGTLMAFKVSFGMYLVSEAKIKTDTCQSGLDPQMLNDEIINFQYNNDDKSTSIRSSGGYFTGQRRNDSPVPPCGMGYLTDGPTRLDHGGCSWNTFRTNAIQLAGDDLFMIHDSHTRRTRNFIW